MSSVSTATSTRTSTTKSSQRLSQSSASSLLSSLSLDEPIEESLPAEVLLDDPSVPSATSPIQANRSEKTLRRRSQDKKDSLTRPPISSSPLANDAQKTEHVPTATGKVKTRPPSIALGNTPLPTPVSAWMGSVGSSVGRKWEEMQKTETYVPLYYSTYDDAQFLF